MMPTRFIVFVFLLACWLGPTSVCAQTTSNLHSEGILRGEQQVSLLELGADNVEMGDARLVASQIFEAEANSISAKKALLKSLLLPGLGHKHVNDGRWSGWAVTFAAADVSLWLSLLGGEWHRNSLITSYEALATGSANADIQGKDRSFFLNLASFESSTVFYDTMLRNRQWDQIGYVSDEAFQWEWDSEESFNKFRSLRNDAESLRRRKSILIASLVVNRIVSGAISARKASRIKSTSFSMSLSAPVEDLPVLSLRVGF